MKATNYIGVEHTKNAPISVGAQLAWKIRQLNLTFRKHIWMFCHYSSVCHVWFKCRIRFSSQLETYFHQQREIIQLS